MLFKHLKSVLSQRNVSFVQKRHVEHSSVYVSTCQDIHYNLAFEDWIYKNVKFDKRVMLMIWRNKPCVVIGRHQNPWAECNLAVVDSNNEICLARRNSGGGAVYHDMGNINMTFFTHRDKYNRKENLELVARALNSFGLHAQLNERDDLVNKGFKISGSAAKLGREVAYHHCTLLLDVNLDNLTTTLQPTMPGLETKATESVISPCQNLLEFCPQLTYQSIVSTVSEGFLEKYGNKEANFTYVDPTNANHFPKLFDIYQDLTSWKWRYGMTPKFSIKRTFTNKGITLEVTIEVNKGKIDDIDVTFSGATNNVLTNDMTEISTQLFGAKLQLDSLQDIFNRMEVSAENSWLVPCLGTMLNVELQEQVQDKM